MAGVLDFDAFSCWRLFLQRINNDENDAMLAIRASLERSFQGGSADNKRR
jgi:hypothetical protein